MLIFQLVACLILSTWGCQEKSCQPFTGWNNCFDNGIKEPKLPPRDNTCCGPHCVYTGPNPPSSGPCDCNPRTRCLLDTHCLLSFPWTEKVCLGMNKKCGINCCCRENCPTLFCKF
ncbi:hypothetical protein M5D96_003399 [Drosophila gunungcola]|uniref:Uncharacterized protein n=1 Tax=Drosophila gunungcola TaxID=103775 RepID=A0A9Q0BRN9_9MUSC|nr:hypothetical protein M5D96_003399 [Drosophila gunungcola]